VYLEGVCVLQALRLGIHRISQPADACPQTTGLSISWLEVTLDRTGASFFHTKWPRGRLYGQLLADQD